MRARIVAAFLASPVAGIAFAQTPALSPEFQVNTFTPGTQLAPAVAKDAAGNFVVVWVSGSQDGSALGVFGQRFQETGAPLGTEFQVNTYTTSNQNFPRVAMDPGGGFVVVWSSYQDGDFDGVFAQRYDSAGSAHGPEFQVNTYTTGREYRPSIAADNSGNFIVVWTSTDQDGSQAGVFGQRFHSDGTSLGSEFQINTYTTGSQFGPDVAMTGDGAFVVVWTSDGQDGSANGVFARLYDNAGQPIGDDFQINTYTTSNERIPRVAMDTAGNFVVVWTSKGGQDGSAYGVFGRRFDSGGVPYGPDFQVNTYTTGYQIEPAVKMGAAGDFLVIWHSDPQDGSSIGNFVQYFNTLGEPEGNEFQVSALSTGNQDAPAVILDDNGHFVIAWASQYGDGSGYGIVARRGDLHAVHSIQVDAHGDGAFSNLNGILEPGEAVVVEPSWRNTGSDPLTLTGTATNLTGPAGAVYGILDGSADYGLVQPGAVADCYDASADCYLMTVDNPRPATHWDATFDESVTGGLGKTWTLHVGGSFTDVLPSHIFYRYVETVLHNGVTGGCGGESADTFCPSDSTLRKQMAVFLLKAKHGPAFVPSPCVGLFADVLCPSQFADWIEQLSADGITGGCGSGNYCPDNPVTRAQMAVFLLKAEHGSSYIPPTCTGVFPDVPCPSLFADWIEQLAAEAITGGCGDGNYCPNNPNTRGQMAVFLVKTFGLLLYGP